MLDHGLEIVAYALKLRQSHLLPAGATPEAQAAQAEAWTAGTAYAALLHDIGKIAVDLHVEYADGTVWHPWHGPLRRPYRFRYRREREYRLHSAATGLLYARLLDPGIFDWLADYPDLWAALLYVLAGQYEHAGMLGELVVQADQASVAQELGGDPSKALAAPRHALQRKLLDGLRYLLKEEFKLNQPQASDGWLTQDALWLVSKTVSDKLRAHLLSQGIDGIPASNTAVFNVLQDHGIALATPDGKGDLEGHRHQRCRLVAQLHLPETVSGHGLGCGRPAGAVRGSRAGRRGTRGADTAGTGIRSARLGKRRYGATKHRADRPYAHRQRRGCAARSAE